MITVTYIPELDEAVTEALRADLLKIDPQAKMTGRDPGPQAIVEFALPAIIGVALAGVSAGFLQEAGKDLYNGLKAWIISAYEAANQTPVYWRGPRREPTLRPSDTNESSIESEREPRQTKMSPPLKLALAHDDTSTRLTFVFPQGLTPEQVDEAYDAIPGTVDVIGRFAAHFERQVSCKTARHKTYRGTMPEDMWLEKQMHERAAMHEITDGNYLFDYENLIWVRVL